MSVEGFRPVPPLIRELVNLLPPPGSQWPARERLGWLLAAAGIFDLLYGVAEGLTIELEPSHEAAAQTVGRAADAATRHPALVR